MKVNNTLVQEVKHFIQEAGEDLSAIPATPNELQLTSLIYNTFWASYEREESRPLKFGVAFREPIKWSGASIFQKPLPFDINSIKKLAPALVPGDNYLGVWPNDKEELFIWGITNYEGDTQIQIIDSGLLVLRFKSDIISIITGTSVHEIDKNVFSTYRHWFEETENSIPQIVGRSFSFEALHKLVSSMRFHGNGGTILIIPSDSTTWMKSIKQPVINLLEHPSEGIKKRIDSIRIAVMRKINGGTSKTDMLRGLIYLNTSSDTIKLISHLMNEVKKVANLSAVDGALLMNYSLDVIAFGVKINPVDSSDFPENISSLSPFQNVKNVQISLAKIGGTRHQSAAQFVYDQQGSVAIVASQDGVISAFSCRGKERQVQMIRNLEITLRY